MLSIVFFNSLFTLAHHQKFLHKRYISFTNFTFRSNNLNILNLKRNYSFESKERFELDSYFVTGSTEAEGSFSVVKKIS